MITKLLSAMFLTNSTSNVIVESSNINLFSNKAIKDLEYIIPRGTDIGNFEDFTKDMLIQNLEKSYGINTNEIEITDIGYGMAKIKAIQGSYIYRYNISYI
ncbi:hypothetical protein [Spiroplasma floricola]|uniref:hypothetical protein n=1 Tax=Spiroplasma floricola TaxID=216937 RepID=UPI000C2D0211|nr:hypothetical protein [Spiroplasma floricola]